MTHIEALRAYLATHWADERGVCRCEGCTALRELLHRTDLESRVATWVRTRIGPDHMHRRERAMRLLEEAIELAQAEGIESWRVTSQMRHVYARPAGEPSQEAAGVAVCLLSWCAATGNTFADLALAEIERIEAKPLEQIRGSLERKADADLVTCVEDASREIPKGEDENVR